MHACQRTMFHMWSKSIVFWEAPSIPWATYFKPLFSKLTQIKTQIVSVYVWIFLTSTAMCDVVIYTSWSCSWHHCLYCKKVLLYCMPLGLPPMPTRQSSQLLKTFITPFGRFKYLCALYGLSSIVVWLKLLQISMDFITVLTAVCRQAHCTYIT